MSKLAQRATPARSRKRRWWQTGESAPGRAFDCPLCRKPLKGGGNGALASHFRAAHPIADWTHHRRNAP